MPPKELNPTEKKIFESIDKNDFILLKSLLTEAQDVNILDENLMTPLQHAAYKGNKEIVQLLLDRGADPNVCEHEHSYTALHFGGLSGNVDVCNLLLLGGAKPNLVNTVGRTAAQMAGFVGNRRCVAAINNFVSKPQVEQSARSRLPPFLWDDFHKFLIAVNIHPIKIALNLREAPRLLDHLDELQNVLETMCKEEMKSRDANEVIALKCHYLAYIISWLSKINKNRKDNEKKFDVVELFAKKLLKPDKEFMDNFLRECIREFPFTECALFRQLVASLANKDSPPAINVLTTAINGHRGFVEDNVPTCRTCGEENPAKKCSKCKSTQYCDRNCQRLDWFVHKKICARSGQTGAEVETEMETQPSPSELSEEIHKLLINN